MVIETVQQFREQELASERYTNAWRTENYTIPLLDRLFSSATDKQSIRVLSVGCGNGEDVDTLMKHGYSAFGVDIGYRSKEWQRKDHPERFKLADAKALPFENSFFDVVLSFGVIEHIGAVGDSLDLLPDYQNQRARYASEMLRVIKPGGYIIVSTPNRHFCMDMWHGPFTFGVRFHSPFEKFLTSYREITSLFVKNGGCSEVKVLTLERFFQFKKSGKRLWIRILLPAIRFAIAVISNVGFLRKSFLNPFLIICFRKAGK